MEIDNIAINIIRDENNSIKHIMNNREMIIADIGFSILELNAKNHMKSASLVHVRT